MARGKSRQFDFTDQRIGLLTARLQIGEKTWPDGSSSPLWICDCDCGNFVERTRSALLAGSDQSSCGCLRKADPEQTGFKAVLKNYRRSAIARGIAFELTIQEFQSLIEGNCRYCGVGPSNVWKWKTFAYVYNGIDRLNSSIGYRADNVVTCCKTCNMAKSQMFEDEFLEWICRVHRHSVNG